MNETQKRIYDYVKHLCSSCILYDQSGRQLDNIPVLLTRHVIADKLSLSDKTVQRNLDWLVSNNYIYKISFGSNYIYNIKPITNNDFLCRVKI